MTGSGVLATVEASSQLELCPRMEMLILHPSSLRSESMAVRGSAPEGQGSTEND